MGAKAVRYDITCDRPPCDRMFYGSIENARAAGWRVDERGSIDEKWWRFYCPHEAKPPVTQPLFTLTPTGETRHLNNGEWYEDIGSYGDPPAQYLCPDDGPSPRPHRVLKLERLSHTPRKT